MLSHTLIRYCRLFSRDLDDVALRVFLESSPQYPNLLSVLQTLSYVGLDGQAGQCDWEYLRYLTGPFLLHTKRGNRENLIIAKWDTLKNCLKTYNYRKNKWDAVNHDNVKAYWDGVLIYCNNAPLGKGIISKKRLFVSLIILGILLFVFYVSSDIMIAISYTPLILGSIISGYQFFRSCNLRNGLVERLCHIKGADCDKVEESAYSQIFGIKMSCLAFSFFVSQLVYVVLCNLFGMNNALQFVYFISVIIVLPTTAYSVYVQLKVNSLCPLCVCVILSLIVEASFLFMYANFNVCCELCIMYCGLFAITVAILQCIHIIKRDESETLYYRISMLLIKRKKETILTNSRPITRPITPIRLGNNAARVRITAFVSPNCVHCRKTIFQLLTMIHKGVDFQMEIILGESTKYDSQVIDSWIKSYLSDKNTFFEELFLWSSGSTKQSVSKSNKLSKDNEIYRITMIFKDEIRNLNIDRFPRIILNDRLLSTIYTHKDIEYIIWDSVFDIRYARDIGEVTYKC